MGQTDIKRDSQEKDRQGDKQSVTETGSETGWHIEDSERKMTNDP